MKHFITTLLLVFNFLSYSQVVSVDSVKYYLVEFINEHRINKGLSILTYDNKLESSAQKHTDYMFVEGVLSHNESNENNPNYVGFSPWDRGCSDEICFKGTIQFTNNRDVAILMFRTWCKSPSHYSSIISEKNKYFGVGLNSTEPSDSLKLFIMLSTITFNY
jgi:uncharacterized protein YkwD